MRSMRLSPRAAATTSKWALVQLDDDGDGDGDDDDDGVVLLQGILGY